jgi:hypothetical protein
VRTYVRGLPRLAYARFRRSLDNRSVTNALACAAELNPLPLIDALDLLLLLRDRAPDKYPRATLRWHARLVREIDLDVVESQAVLAALAVLAGERKRNAAFALAELLSRRRCEQLCERLIEWARACD